mmetsp:Transcript_20478/g.40272  ORF Transcript_20478/g.40272 Transcript_20478/m.40272 type:complete len:117 (+) Transcript_20478:1738-2088(+)
MKRKRKTSSSNLPSFLSVSLSEKEQLKERSPNINDFFSFSVSVLLISSPATIDFLPRHKRAASARSGLGDPLRPASVREPPRPELWPPALRGRGARAPTKRIAKRRQKSENARTRR